MPDLLTSTFAVLNEIFSAANAITAFSLLLYSLTFHLRERVARTFAILLACVAWVYSAEVLAGTAQTAAETEIWMRLQWAGIAFLSPAYLHLSDALLAATGRPSRGRRHLLIRLTYGVAAVAFAAAGVGRLLADDLVAAGPIRYLRPGPALAPYLAFSLATVVLAGVNFWRAYRRCLTRDSRRRMAYFLVGSMGPFLGGFPFLMVAGAWPLNSPGLLLGVAALVNAAVAAMLVLMAYPVAYYGVSYPDRVVKSRLFQWLLRGPIVASTVLAVTVTVNRFGLVLGLENSRAVPLAMVASLLLMQFVITWIRPTVERWIFYGQDRDDVSRLHLLEERLLTTGDLRQFLEALLNAVSNISGARSAFLAALGDGGLELEVAVGPEDPLRGPEDLPQIVMSENAREVPPLGTLFAWNGFWLAPLRGSDGGDVIGLLGFRQAQDEPDFTPEEAAALKSLADRAAVALSQRKLQREVFAAVDRLVPQAEEIQRLRAAARYAGATALTAASLNGVQTDADLAHWVREALGHYWGGPRLTRSPLLGLQVVRRAMERHKGNPVNALRSILRQAMERVRPEGERRFTGDWMLYNILEMKFLEGRKVRDIAMRLAMSEADLYRKQRVAIEAVAKAIAEMEREATRTAVGS